MQNNICSMIGYLGAIQEQKVNRINDLIDKSNVLCASGNLEFAKLLDNKIDREYHDFNLVTDRLNRMEGTL